ncbi:interleukin-1 receptor-like 1 [Fukomys damarensis]|uniref:interleukin-1 receptor-like 1 n=1 Tax=Fukomys damarensis TaxID=885580 RepID=UPI001455A0D0|nr:interleukin-1 receptor-like 1 [Fukomys damarensis]
MSNQHSLLTDKPRRGLWMLVTLIVPMYFIAAKGKSSWGQENEALLVRCPKQGGSRYPVDWYYLKTNESIPTQKRNRVFASGEWLKFLPAKVVDSGVYTCVIRSSPTWNKIGYINITIYKRPTDCHIPDYLMYSTASGSGRNSRIYCPTIDLYNWTAPLKWFKNCKALQGSRYRTHRSYLFIDNVGRVDEGDYTCKFTHTENGISYNVTATRSFTVKDKPGVSVFPVIVTPSCNETKEVEIGKKVLITCMACFGTGLQSFTAVLWQVNQSNVKDLGITRIQEEQEQSQSSSNDTTCLNTVLRISEVKEEDLSLKYDCLARNLHGVVRHTTRLIEKKPSKKCL